MFCQFRLLNVLFLSLPHLLHFMFNVLIQTRTISLLPGLLQLPATSSHFFVLFPITSSYIHLLYMQQNELYNTQIQTEHSTLEIFHWLTIAYRICPEFLFCYTRSLSPYPSTDHAISPELPLVFLLPPLLLLVSMLLFICLDGLHHHSPQLML